MLSNKKAVKSKRTSLPRTSDYTKSFVKDWNRLNRSGRYDMHLLKNIMMRLISNDAPLDQQQLDHALKGEWSDHRECHIGGDFLLIYRLQGNMIVFVRTGSHAELFN